MTYPPSNSPKATVPGYLPGGYGIWTFVLIDGGFFALLFLSFGVAQMDQQRLFANAQRLLDVRLGIANTMVLATSSWCVANAVHNARRSASRCTRLFLVLAAGCGATFAMLKIWEYGSRITAGITAQTNDFFMFYFVITFIHLAHVIAGVIVLLVMVVRARRYGPDHIIGLETGATYWHMVDLLWMIIFPLLYLVRWQ